MAADQKDFLKTERGRLARRVALAMTEMKNTSGMREKYPVGLIDIDLWEWPQGVGLYGLTRYYERTGDENVFRFLCDWMDRHLKAGPPERNVNTTIPCLTLLILYERTKRAEYLEACAEWAEWIMRDLIRLEDGIFQHMITGDPNDGQILIDTLFMAVLFLARMGRVLHRQEYRDEALRQILVHIKYLYDPAHELFYHGYDFRYRHHYGAVHWGRGNAWFTAVMAELITELAPTGGVYDYLRDTFEDHCRALAALQEKNGLWHTVLDDPDSYCETSASACIAYGILRGINLGLLPAELASCAEKAIEGVIGQIDENGVVQGVSYGTPVGNDAEFYKTIPVCPMTYGQALTLLMLTEAEAQL